MHSTEFALFFSSANFSNLVPFAKKKNGFFALDAYSPETRRINFFIFVFVPFKSGTIKIASKNVCFSHNIRTIQIIYFLFGIMRWNNFIDTILAFLHSLYSNDDTRVLHFHPNAK